MEEILAFIAEKMQGAGIPYEFGEWNSEVSYPYSVGTFTADSYRYEDGCTSGTMTVDIWSRGTKFPAVQTADRIAEIFADMQEVQGDCAFFIRYGGAQTIPSGEMGLFRVQVTLYASKWKGD